MMRWIVLTMLLVPCLAFAADFWDGNAALQRGDATFESGLNVASNSFPPGTQITIFNEDTGKSVVATVTGRIDGQSDIGLLMSPKTAEALGVSQGTLGRVRVTAPPAATPASGSPGDQTASRDPDLNPAASEPAPAAPTQVADAAAPAAAAPAAATGAPAEPGATSEPPAAASGEPAATPEEPAATPTPPATTAEQPATTPEEPPATAEQPAATPAPTPEGPPAGTGEAPAAAETPASPSNDDAAILSDAQSRNPQKQMFQPPREDQKFVYQPEAVPTTPTTASAGTPQGQVASVEEPGAAPPASQQSSLPLADVTAPEESRPEEIVGAGTAVPAPSTAPQAALATPEVTPQGSPAVAEAPVQTEVTGPQAIPPAAKPAPRVALAPPEAPPAQKPAGTQPAAGTGTTVASTTPATTPPVTPKQPTATVTSATAVPRTGPGTYYLQLAAYGSEKGAKDLAAKLAPTYPALVLTPSATGSQVYKVVIGPLNRAESGTLLTWFRYRGFPDAFLKQE